ncbi:MAG TPA: NnrU family protein [Candidatus Binataceae bacterium]|nr:NnrU family protein [Candidatus Binataceae bacterium]
MNAVGAIALWAFLFLATHLGISSGYVRPRLLAAVGDQAYRGIYSLVSLATFIPLAVMFGRHKHAGAMLWNLRDVAAFRGFAWLLMLLSITFIVAGSMNPSPATAGASAAAAGPRGVLKIARHPAFTAFTLFGVAHMMMNGWLGDVIFFATFPALGCLGAVHQDSRKLREMGAPYRKFMDETSLIPGQALISGKQRWEAGDTPRAAILIGVGVTLALVVLHPYIFGGHPLG